MKPDLLKDDIKILLKTLAIPSSVGMFFNTMYNVIDTFYAGLISTTAIAGMSFSFFLYFVFMGLGFGISSAITSLVGNLKGEGKRNRARLFGSNGIGLVLIISLISILIGYLIAPFMFKLMGAKGESLEFALKYIYIIFIGMIFFLLTFGMNSTLVAIGDTKSMRNISIAGLILNIALNPLFIYGYGFVPSFGFEGIAISTVCIQFINFLYISYKVQKSSLIDFTKIRFFIPTLKVSKQITTQALPPTLNMLTMSFGQLIIAYFVATYGFSAVAGYGIGFRVEQIMLLPAIGISTAVLSITSNNFGAKQYDRVKECFKLAIIYAFSICLIGIFVIGFLGKYMVSIFDNSPLVIEYSYTYALTESFGFFGYVTIFICVSILQGIKKPTFIAYISAYRQIILPIILYSLIVFYFQLPISNLWLGILFTISTAGLIIFIYTKHILEHLNNS